jgi:hypothetical protein
VFSQPRWLHYPLPNACDVGSLWEHRVASHSPGTPCGLITEGVKSVLANVAWEVLAHL